MDESSEGALVAVLANPPLTDGQRTLRRVELAAQLLGFSNFDVANLFAIPSRATGAIAELGIDEKGWLEARPSLECRLTAAQGVLLAYGASAPTGRARAHFRQQVEWLDRCIITLDLPAWQVGDGPRHPSRWQRWTYRTYPESSFADALRRSLVSVNSDRQ